jgi:hypothetical protein
MELYWSFSAPEVDMDTEGIWGALGLLSFIALIVLLRWLGTPEDQKKVTPRVPKEEEGREAKKREAPPS